MMNQSGRVVTAVAEIITEELERAHLLCHLFILSQVLFFLWVLEDGTVHNISDSLPSCSIGCVFFSRLIMVDDVNSLRISCVLLYCSFPQFLYVPFMNA